MTIIAVAMVAALIAAIVAGARYEHEARRQDLLRFPRIGRAVDIGGRTLNIYCSGEGSPAVILESGAPESGYSWVFVQREIAKFTRACWYDRAGYGWSDPGPDPRTSAAIAKELHELLQAAGIVPPYVLAGAAFGGLHVRVYNGLYPRDVAGMVLVDSVHGDEGTRMPRSLGPLPAFLHYPQSRLAQAMNEIGLLRVGAHHSTPGPPPKELTSDEWATIWGLRDEPKTRAALLQELVADPSEEAHAAGNLGDRPLIVLSSATGEDDTVSMELQAELARLSTRARHVVVNNGHNAIYYNAPDAVIAAIREVAYQRR